MKKSFYSVLGLLFVVILSACGGNNSKYYFAVEEADQDSSWVYWVTVETKKDKMVDIKWSAFNIAGDSDEKFLGKDKYTASVEGLYDMHPGVADEDKLWWHEQADILIENLLETQDVNAREPIPSGATIVTDNFYELVEKALASEPVKKGKYQDGYHFLTLKDSPAESKESIEFYDPVKEEVVETGAFDSYTFGSFVVLNGSIVYAYYNNVYYGYRISLDEEGKIVRHEGKVVTEVYNPDKVSGPKLYKTKNQLGISYQMSLIMGVEEYYVQARNAGLYLVEHQSFPELVENDSGYQIIDGFTGCTIDADDFRTLWLELPKK